MQENNKSNEHSNAPVALVDLIPDVVVIIDIAGKIVSANGAVGKYTGYKPEESVGKNFLEPIFFEKEEKSIFTVALPIEPKFEIGGENIWVKTPESS